MVLPPPAAHDESVARDADWIEQIKLGLRLSRAGILIHVDQGRPEHLGKLVRALLPEHPNLEVFTDVRTVLNAKPGSVLVVVPKPEDAEALNLNRPIFAQRQLQVVLYCDRQTTLALTDRAVDFFDSVSQHHRCPEGPPDFAVQGLRKAVAANAPGIVWTGSIEGLVRVFAATFPGETLQWMRPTVRHDEFVKTIRAVRDAWVACFIRDTSDLFEFRRTLTRLGKPTRAIALMETVPSLGWWPVNDTCSTVSVARSAFLRAGMVRPGRLVALTGLEMAALQIASQLSHAGVNEADLFATLMSDADPGAALADRAHAMGLVNVRAVAFRNALAPLLRALDDAPDVLAWRQALMNSVLDAPGAGLHLQVALPTRGPSDEAYWLVRREEAKLFLIEANAGKMPSIPLDSLLIDSSDTFAETPGAPQLSAVNLGHLRQGEYSEVLKSLHKQRDRKKSPRDRSIIDQLRARLWLDLLKDDIAARVLQPAVERETWYDGPSTPLLGEFMLDLALLLHRQGDTTTVFALLRKLLSTEWESLHLDAGEVGDAAFDPTPWGSVNDYIYLFLAESNSPPPLPPESRARALRILAEVLLAQGRYEEAEDVARKAHETALHAHEIARPETWRALALCGCARALQGRRVEGKKDLERAIALATHDFGQTHPEVARLWLDLVRIQARFQDAETFSKAIDIWQHAQIEPKERNEAFEELRRMALLTRGRRFSSLQKLSDQPSAGVDDVSEGAGD